MLRFIIKISFITIFIFFSLELSSRYLMNYNAPFKERFGMSLEYTASLYGTSISPDQTIFETNQGMIVDNKIKYRIY